MTHRQEKTKNSPQTEPRKQRLTRQGEEVRCSKCNSASGYVRVITHEYVCRRCGVTSPLHENDRSK